MKKIEKNFPIRYVFVMYFCVFMGCYVYTYGGLYVEAIVFVSIILHLLLEKWFLTDILTHWWDSSSLTD